MKYNIEYAALCHKGKVRAKNQDNLWCNGVFLNSKNEGLPEMVAGMVRALDLPAFAVFDGMGGEQQGEMAAYIAASGFDRAYVEGQKGNPGQFLSDTCAGMNSGICQYAKENRIRQMGTTAAILMFPEKDVFVCNIGDSRVYQYSGKKLAQISRDHSETGVTGRKPPLTQNLGIPEDEFLIEPYMAKGSYRAGDRYLICSDGLTDMLTDHEIYYIISTQKSVANAVRVFVNMALEKGGVDNITVILCEVQKQRLFF